MGSRGSIVIQVLPDYAFDKLKTRPQKSWLRQTQPALLLPLLPERGAVEGLLPEREAVEGNGLKY